MGPILWELLNSIFVDFPSQEAKLQGPNSMQGLFAMQTYFDKYREQLEIIDDVSPGF